MAESIEQQQLVYPFSLECDVLPIIKLARWSAQAGEFLTVLHALRQGAPDVDRLCQQVLCMAPWPDTIGSGALVAGGLGVAELMLQRFVDAHGGDV